MKFQQINIKLSQLGLIVSGLWPKTSHPHPEKIPGVTFYTITVTYIYLAKRDAMFQLCGVKLDFF